MRAWLILASSALAPALALAQEGGVDWERRVVRCEGSGAPTLSEAAGAVSVTRVGMQRAAMREALHDCMATLRGVSIQTGRTVAAALAGDPALASSVEEAVKRFRSGGDYRFFSDGGVKLRVEVPLDGDISALLLPPAAPGGRAGGEPAAGGSTGVLVDASAHALEYALAPRILDEAGGEVYGSSSLDERARRGGTAAYAVDVPSARRAFAARLGGAPRLVKAIRAQGADVVISSADAQALRGGAWIREGRVVIIARRRP
jgi:hypothetical protein